VEFKNESGLTFVDVSSEAERTYHFTGGDAVKIREPQRLHVSDSGGHRLFDAAGQSHYIPSGWLRLTWTAKPGAPHFVK
jgi:hypothetical protein